MENSRVVREVTEYEDGTIEERILHRKDEEKKEYEAPGPSPLTLLGLLALGGLAAYFLWKHRFDIAYRLGNVSTDLTPESEAAIAPSWETPKTAPGGYAAPRAYKIYGAETPRPMVDAGEYVGPVECSGRAIR